MNRRQFLAGATALGTVGVLSRPALAQMGSQSNARTLHFVPESNLATPDPVWNVTPVTRNHGMMVWDMLYGLDANFEPQPQMAAGHELSDDRLTWRFTLRDGLFWHDGEPVRPADCIASIVRWSKRRPLGQRLLALAEEMKPLDDRRFEIRLKRPFAQLTRAFSEYCFMMPERIAKTDAFSRIGEYVGSGPYRFEAQEWVSGAQAVYTRFDKYQPRNEAPSFMAGGKQVHFDRVVWHVMPDPATAAAALQSGEVDWVQQPQFDLLPMLRGSRGVKVAVNDKVGVTGMLALNHLYPPFDNVKLRQAILSAVDQKEFVAAAVGDDPSMSRVPVGVFPPGMPMASDAGLEALTAPRDLARSRKLVAESGYRGEPVLVMGAVDSPVTQAFAQVVADLFQKLGLNVDYVGMDLGTLVQRRANKAPPDKGGWNAFTTTYEGLSISDPGNNIALRGNGPDAWFGWPTSRPLEELREQWFDATDEAGRRRIAAEIQRTAFQEVPFIPLGQLFYPTAFRSNVEDILPAAFPVFWNVRKV
ncbi:ABC transporter substrate-binding protein [Roseomonas gilardii]|uniref:ABC transporter substrate-binding protein n=1 Tax=Roseomonas gilardii TaxID=257708 RepID=UPI00119E64BF|nr:ABC transporter substrate-binding protein [Roseomonas gilardii]